METGPNAETLTFTNPRHAKRIITANWEILIAPGEQEIIVRARGSRVAGRHNRLVEALVNYLVHLGWKIRADGVNVPAAARLNITLTVGRNRADVVAFDGSKYHYFEVKTLTELTTDHTRRQLLEYAQELEEINLVVPPEAKDRAEDLIILLRLEDKVRLWVIHDRGPGQVPTVEIIKVQQTKKQIYPEGTDIRLGDE